MGILDLLLNLFKGGKATDLIDEAQEKLQDGSLDDVLQKVGMDGEQLGSIAGGVITIIGLAKKAFGMVSLEKSEDEEAEEETEETEEEYEEEEADEEETEDEEAEEEFSEEELEEEEEMEEES